MKFLIYGSKGFIGSNLILFLQKKEDVKIIEGKERCDNYELLKNEIGEHLPNFVISCLNRSSEYKVDVEHNLKININDNQKNSYQNLNVNIVKY